MAAGGARKSVARTQAAQQHAHAGESVAQLRRREGGMNGREEPLTLADRQAVELHGARFLQDERKD